MANEIFIIKAPTDLNIEAPYAMSPTWKILLHLLMIATMIGDAIATNDTSTGCNLNIPKAVRKHKEAEAEPLVINITIIIKCVRDVPDSGGSFATDFK